jgi:hypothetical protein
VIHSTGSSNPLYQAGKVRLRIAVRPDELNKDVLACPKFRIGQPTSEEFIAQPDPIGIDSKHATGPVSIHRIPSSSVLNSGKIRRACRIGLSESSRESSQHLEAVET